jgi:hypothetical protein
MAVDLDAQRMEVMSALTAAMELPEAERSRLLGVKGAALATATAANLDLRTAPTLTAIERYTGVLYDAIDLPTMSPSARRRIRSSVLIVSGLWGAVAPDDPIPAYRLKMGASLSPLGTLSTWWRGPLSAVIAARARGRRVWNLLPNEHAAAWRPPGGLRQTSVRFLEPGKDGRLVAVSHRNKALKGALVRLLVDRPGVGADDLRDWEHPSGYRLDPALTEERDGVEVLSLVKRD